MSGLPPIKIHFMDSAFIKECLAVIPSYKHERLLEQHAAVYPFNRREANLMLLAAKEQQERLIDGWHGIAFPKYAKPKALKDMGDYHANECRQLVESQGNQAGFDYCNTQGIDAPVINQSATRPEDTNSLESVVNRITDGSWWDRKLAVKRSREAELRRIKAHIIGKGKQVYCSDICTEQFIARQQSTLDYMATMELVSDAGDVVPMAEIFKGSIANPSVRRAELMVRMYGFDQYAQEHGDRTVFYTLTAPSKYHSTSRKYNGASPRDTQQYLMKLWARCRAKLKYNNLEIYGFRIVEPHLDSTPHIHMILFMKDGTQDAITAIIKEYAFQEDGTERGADKGRFKADHIKAGLGYATAYILKYVSKNLDGHGVGEDIEAGQDSEQTSTRVRAWASRWGIRQFQQIGGAPVGVWRQLRKLKSTDNDLLERARVAADNADWKTYLELQGGALTKRKDQLIKTFSETCIDTDTGEVKQSRYGEFLQKIKGLQVDTEKLTTQVLNWTMQAVDVTPTDEQDATTTKRSAELESLRITIETEQKQPQINNKKETES